MANKLFVGQIPRDTTETDLQQMFSEYGVVEEVSIIRDRVTKEHKGCAFVSYSDPNSAYTAIEVLHGKQFLGNSPTAMQVKIADSRPQGERDYKLFVGMLPKTMNEDQIRHVFQIFGEVIEVHIICDVYGNSRGCAFLKYREKHSAMRAIDEVNQKMSLIPGRALTVKFADKGRGDKSGDDRYWMSSQPVYQYPQLVPVSMQYPVPQHHPPGYGMSPYSPPPPQYMVHAAAPYETNGGARGGYYETNIRQHQVKPPQPNQAYSSYAPQPPVSRSPPPVTSANPSEEDRKEGAAVSEGAAVGGAAQTAEDEDRPPEGPPGANLFIYHLPHDLTDADLATLFSANEFGNVVSAKVYVDKKTGESKGFGFVSYDSPPAADMAISQMNGFQIGSKRLKVQHKRIRHNTGMPTQQQSIPMMHSMDGGGGAQMMQSMQAMHVQQGSGPLTSQSEHMHSEGAGAPSAPASEFDQGMLNDLRI